MTLHDEWSPELSERNKAVFQSGLLSTQIMQGAITAQKIQTLVPGHSFPSACRTIRSARFFRAD